MNIVYMHTHDTGRFIEPFGYAVSTPNLMQLAREGTLFRQAYCAGPTCSPSRAGLLTGMSPHSCGMIGLAHRGFALNDYSKHLAQFLGRQGYETVLCGVQHVAAKAETIGYHKVFSAKGVSNGAEQDRANARHAAAYIKNVGDKPFFLSVGLINTHRKYPEIDPSINPNYVVPPSPLYDTPETRKDMAAFMTSAMIADGCFGTVLDAIRESGHEDDTLVMYTTDHGIAFPEMKCNLYDTGIGISLILKYPGNPRMGQAVDALVSQLDIFPTLCDFTGAEKPDWLQGVSLLPLLTGQTDKVHDEIFSEVTYHAAYEPMRCVRTERYKLIRHYSPDDRRVPANVDDSPSKTFLAEHGYLEKRRAMEMLFDLYLDPNERVNLVGDPEYRGVYDDLTGRLDRWQAETNDPVLAGYVPKPKGAIANTRTCFSPEEDAWE